MSPRQVDLLVDRLGQLDGVVPVETITSGISAIVAGTPASLGKTDSLLKISMSFPMTPSSSCHFSVCVYKPASPCEFQNRVQARE